MSSDYENDIAKKVHRGTRSAIRAYRCGYSGNGAAPQPDVLLTTPTENYAVELKGPIQSDRVYVDDEDIDQLVDCTNTYTAAALVVKFSHREPVVVRYFPKLSGDQMVAEGAKAYNEAEPAEKLARLVPDAFNARITESGSLALDKPTTDEWPSATAGASDVDAILSGLGIATESSVEVEGL